MTFEKKSADLFVPDGLPLESAVGRTTHMGIGAHQDDLEFFAAHGILDCFGRDDRWFLGVTVTNGVGSARTGPYAAFTPEEMGRVRKLEQRKAAMIGEYGGMIQLDYSSEEIKDAGNRAPTEDLARILLAAQPEVLYLHNPFDKHETHLVLLARCVAALRTLPPEAAPKRILGCEVWRDLDWLPESKKVVLPLSDRTNLQAALNGVFDSQISGGKRYDLAVMGRRLAHATFHESHAVDEHAGLIFAVDLTPLADPEGPSLAEFAGSILGEFQANIGKVLDSLSPLMSA